MIVNWRKGGTDNARLIEDIDLEENFRYDGGEYRKTTHDPLL